MKIKSLQLFGVWLLVACVGACGEDSTGNGGNGGDSDAAVAIDATIDSGVAGSFDLTFSGTSYAPHNGQTMHVKVVDMGDNSTVQTDTATVTTGGFSFEWTEILADGRDYEIRWYVDHNSNGLCNNPPEDHSWVHALTNVAASSTYEHVHNTNTTPVCEIFGEHALTFTGSDFAPHNGQMLHAALIASDDSVVARGSTTIASGAFTFDWAAPLVDGQSYSLHFYADHNSSGDCDSPPTDHVWSAGIGTATADVAFNYAHDTNTTDVCSTFP